MPSLTSRRNGKSRTQLVTLGSRHKKIEMAMGLYSFLKFSVLHVKVRNIKQDAVTLVLTIPNTKMYQL
jgi:hypothetical protein